MMDEMERKWKKPTYALQTNAGMTETLMLAVHLQKLYQLLHSCGKSKPPTTEPNSFLYVRYSHITARKEEFKYHVHTK
jgi:hypothetical protein